MSFLLGSDFGFRAFLRLARDEASRHRSYLHAVLSASTRQVRVLCSLSEDA